MWAKYAHQFDKPVITICGQGYEPEEVFQATPAINEILQVVDNISIRASRVRCTFTSSYSGPKYEYYIFKLLN
jgi:glycerate kinase